jgi:hypothetical protein
MCEVRIVKTPAPLRLYFCAVPLIAGSLLAGLEQWPWAIVLWVIGACWLLLGYAWFWSRLRKLRDSEALTSRDVIEIDYPRWSRRLAGGYLFLLAAFWGLVIFAAVILFIVAVVRK